MKMDVKKFRGVEAIGIVDEDDVRLAPVIIVLLRDYARRSKKAEVRGISFDDAGMNRDSQSVSNSAKGYLQTKGFGSTDLLSVKRIDKYWVKTKGLILTTDRFIKRAVIYDFPIHGKNLRDIVFTLPEFVGSKEKIYDFKNDLTADTEAIYNLIDNLCQSLIKILEQIN